MSARDRAKVEALTRIAAQIAGTAYDLTVEGRTRGQVVDAATAAIERMTDQPTTEPMRPRRQRRFRARRTPRRKGERQAIAASYREQLEQEGEQ